MNSQQNKTFMPSYVTYTLENWLDDFETLCYYAERQVVFGGEHEIDRAKTVLKYVNEYFDQYTKEHPVISTLLRINRILEKRDRLAKCLKIIDNQALQTSLEL